MPRDGSNIYHPVAGCNDSVAFGLIRSRKRQNTTPTSPTFRRAGSQSAIAESWQAAPYAPAAPRMRCSASKPRWSSKIVTNWDSQIWVPGSFYAASSATGAAPVPGHAFVGQCYSSAMHCRLILLHQSEHHSRGARSERRSTVQPGLRYIREKKAGVWGPWNVDVGSAAVAQPAQLAIRHSFCGNPTVDLRRAVRCAGV